MWPGTRIRLGGLVETGSVVRGEGSTITFTVTDTLSELNITSINELIKYTPNVTFSNNGPGNGAIFMRGLSAGFAGQQSSATISGFPNVALYLDDQSMQFPARNADVYLADIERVEVLEGPQGTLFGGGAQAALGKVVAVHGRRNHANLAGQAQFALQPFGQPGAAAGHAHLADCRYPGRVKCVDRRAL